MKRMIGAVSLACLVALMTPSVVAQSPSAPEEDAALTAGVGSAASLQQPPAQPVSRVYLIRVKPGMDAQWMEAARKHVAWHRQQKDPWTWTAFYVETGRNTGMYGWITQGHSWSDFDKYDATIGKGDSENAMATMGPYEEYYTSGFSVGLLDISNPNPAGTTFPLVNVEHFTVNPAKRMQFIEAVSTVHGALQKGGFKGRYTWSQQVSGSEGLVFNLAIPVGSWAEMAEDPAFERILTAQLGAQGMAKAMQSFSDAVVSSESWTARILPELSYTPGG